MAYNKHKSFEDNVKAIETALTVLSQKRKATEQEKETLSLYSGFGGIKDVLNIGTAKPIPQNMEETANRLLTALGNFSADNKEWCGNTIDSIKTSVLTAFYTPAFIINAVARQIQSTFKKHGLTMRTFLEPSAGIGGFLQVAMNGTKSYAFEKDMLTGIILSLLNDDTETYTAGFETIGEQRLEHTSFDVIASNIPFGNFRVFDADLWRKGGIHEQSTKTIHNYFFVKALELLNEGGLLAFVTSRGVADTPGNKFVREYLVNNANLISAVRLPDNIFMQTGGIEVGSDLLIFQKDTAKSGPTSREAMFLQTSKEKHGEENTEPSNRLFTMPKTTLSTDSRIVTNQFGKLTRRYSWSGTEASMADYLTAILKYDFDRNYRPNLFSNPGIGRQQAQMSLFGDSDINVAKGRRGYTGEMPDWFREGALVVFEGQVGTLEYRKSSHYEDIAVDFVPVDNGSVNMERANDYMPLRSVYFELSNKEREKKTEQAELRERLNGLYDAFTAKWGFFHDNDNKEFISLDSLGNEVLTLEMAVGREIYKSDIMREPVAFKKVDTSVTLSPMEALASSLNYHGTVNIDYMCKTADMAEDEITNALSGEIFYNPITDSWEHRGRFIGGDIVTKLRDVSDILPFLDERKRAFAEISVKALSEALPEPVPYEELDINMGERWIDPKI
uniref:N-6 DNA methylase n=1 Tax=Duncaniella muris TaxID=2094150 RepID=UPI00262CBC77